MDSHGTERDVCVLGMIVLCSTLWVPISRLMAQLYKFSELIQTSFLSGSLTTQIKHMLVK